MAIVTLTICATDNSSYEWLLQQPVLSARLSATADLALTMSRYSDLLSLVSLRPTCESQRQGANLNMLALQSVWLVQGRNDFIEHFYEPAVDVPSNYYKFLQHEPYIVAPLESALALDAVLLGKPLVFPQQLQEITLGKLDFGQAVARAGEAVAERVAMQSLIPSDFVLREQWWQHLYQSAAEADSQWFERMQQAALACVAKQPKITVASKRRALPTPIRKLRKLMRDPYLFFADRQRIRN